MTYFVCPQCGQKIGSIDSNARAFCFGALEPADLRRHPRRVMRRVAKAKAA